MGDKVTKGYCMDCEDSVKIVGKGPNHVLHLLLTVVTFGLWAFVWGFRILGGAFWNCDKCGSPRVKKTN